MSLEEQRDLLRRVVDAYTSSDTFVDPRFGMVALLAGVRPIVPITPHSVLYIVGGDRKSTRLNSSHVAISYAVFCFKKKKQRPQPHAHAPTNPVTRTHSR